MEIGRSVNTGTHTTSRLNVCIDLTDADLILLLFGTKLVKLFDELNVLIENTSLLLSVLFSLLRQLHLQCGYTVLDLLSLLRVHLIHICSVWVIDLISKHPQSVESDNALLELFVCQTVLEEHLLTVVLELSHFLILLRNRDLHLAERLRKTLLAHSQVIHNQDKILIDSIKVLLLWSHLVRLLIQLLNLHFLRADVSLELLNLIVKYKFELL